MKKIDNLCIDDFRSRGAFIARQAKLEGGMEKLEDVLRGYRKKRGALIPAPETMQEEKEQEKKLKEALGAAAMFQN